MAALPTQWKTQDGRIIEITDMDDEHLINTIRHQRRRMLDNTAVFRKESRNPNPVYTGSKVWQLTIMLQRCTEALISLSYEAGKRGLVINFNITVSNTERLPDMGDAVIPVESTNFPQSARAGRNINT